jgi:hypothetical protein
MTTRTRLAALGVTMNQAHDFIKANLQSPATIYHVAQQYGIDSQMVADIMSIDYPGLTAANVEAFFQGQGLNGAALHAQVADTAAAMPMVSSEFSALSNLVGFNTHTGVLSNEALRASVTQITGMDAYLYTFAPINFDGSEDGVFTAAELGVSNFGPMAATWQNIESLVYGTAINMLEAIDVSELHQIETFVSQHAAPLNQDDAATVAQLQGLVIHMVETPTDNPVLSTHDLAASMTQATAVMVQLMGQNQVDNLFSGFIGTFVGA